MRGAPAPSRAPSDGGGRQVRLAAVGGAAPHRLDGGDPVDVNDVDQSPPPTPTAIASGCRDLEDDDGMTRPAGGSSDALRGFPERPSWNLSCTPSCCPRRRRQPSAPRTTQTSAPLMRPSRTSADFSALLEWTCIPVSALRIRHQVRTLMAEDRTAVFVACLLGRTSRRFPPHPPIYTSREDWIRTPSVHRAAKRPPLTRFPNRFRLRRSSIAITCSRFSPHAPHRSCRDSGWM